MKKTWLLGLGFFSISLTWALYNAFVPLFLDDYAKSAALIGFMMTIDNYFAIVLQPWIGHRSDKTITRFGRRMPYLLIGMPLGAVFAALIPLHTGFVTLVLFMVLMNLSMSLFRAPTVALMPDITPEHLRTKANGIINLMGGIGSVLAFGLGSKLYGIGSYVPFLFAGIVMLICLAVLKGVIREPAVYGLGTGAGDGAISAVSADSKRPVRIKDQLDKTTVLILAAIFFWFVAYQGVEALFTLYGTKQLGMSDSEASFSLTFFSLAFLAFALPSGWLGARFGKKPVISLGVAGLFVVFGAVVFVESVFWLRILLIVGGIFWACININSYPWVVATGSEESIGTRTGIYYFVSSLAAITSPPLLGWLIDAFGYPALFVSASLGMLLALLCLLGVAPERKSAGGGPVDKRPLGVK
ncbi:MULTISPECIES: SLC45 family MFS transporter [Paenibacillus]|uniref:Major Facilitator Superfamily protein n=1 Tax=Paenibacillus macerans TaxID=44252 RepID=A0A091A5V7_PAEMA|nr:SLC45 family MFS transporter [Paenibacillus macerans]KFN11636.1 major Facilitator Superfamily protein [Paenibacillus macerans]MCY7560025.1 SLC45 family MFS transporter [Paenibacillus macerans]MEC0154985.1 SLC45 family MFS transporter [Paenibacillus macerans]MEC0332784.1 SLC45 family MFS transporter [Paenibacillus macerans]SUA86014.1 major facilitator superfamily protein [Paenibacillus macerans]